MHQRAESHVAPGGREISVSEVELWNEYVERRHNPGYKRPFGLDFGHFRVGDIRMPVFQVLPNLP
jgi:hypothetical protein